MSTKYSNSYLVFYESWQEEMILVYFVRQLCCMNFIHHLGRVSRTRRKHPMHHMGVQRVHMHMKHTNAGAAPR